MCGWSSMLTILNITSTNSDYEITPLAYQNSGDAGFGDKSRVVGYWAITITHEPTDQELFSLTIEEKHALLELARSTLDAYLKHKTILTK